MSPVNEGARGGAERILDAAILLFGQHGFRGTTLKDIATEAGVSQALIVHHYGTKEQLRSVCDDHVAQLIRERKAEVLEDEPRIDPVIAMRQLSNGRALLRYLIRTLTEGGEHAAQLIDEMVTDAQEYMTQGERAGLIKPSAAPRDRAVLLVLWSLGALVLHEHAQRLLDVDFLASGDSAEDLQRYLYPALELYTQGLVVDGAVDDLSAFLGPAGTTSDSAHDTRKE